MRLYVVAQHAGKHEALSAQLALVLEVPRVLGGAVIPQRARLRERLFTHFALKRLFACVRPHVIFQGLGAEETLSASLTLVLLPLFVQHGMLFQAVCRHVSFGTLVALVRPGLLAVLLLLVSFEARRLGETLAAVGALVFERIVSKICFHRLLFT